MEVVTKMKLKKIFSLFLVMLIISSLFSLYADNEKQEKPDYGFNLSQDGDLVFEQKRENKEKQNIRITNIGKKDIEDLFITLKGVDAQKFVLSYYDEEEKREFDTETQNNPQFTLKLGSLKAGSGIDFKVYLKDYIKIGEYSSIVTVNAKNRDENLSFSKDFNVVGKILPKYDIKIATDRVLDNHVFNTETEGYKPIPAIKVFISNLGDIETGDLSVRITDDNKAAFTLSSDSNLPLTTIQSIETLKNSFFEIKPRDNLKAGTYNATVLVENDNIKNKTFKVAFTVSSTNSNTDNNSSGSDSGSNSGSGSDSGSGSGSNTGSDSKSDSKSGNSVPDNKNNNKTSKKDLKKPEEKNKQPNISLNDKTENTKIDISKEFDDIKENSWYKDSVSYVVEKKIMTGTSKKMFSPEKHATRAELVTILYRFSGSPEIQGLNKGENIEKLNYFNDVKVGAYYYEPVIWAVKNDIVKGISNNVFGSNDNITREQLATLFYRIAKNQNKEITVNGNLNSFKDFDKVSSFAKEALTWAFSNGIITGQSSDILNPKGYATRAEMAIIIKRYSEKFYVNR